jgi:signal transduction histidine kinase
MVYSQRGAGDTVKSSLEPDVNHHRDQIVSRWQDRISLVPSAYRWLAFAIASAQIFLFPSAYYSLTPPVYLVIAVGFYTLLKTLRPLRWQEKSSVTLVLLSLDILVCLFLVLSTAGLYSPFLLYTLAPVLTAALLLDRSVTFTITAASVSYVIGAHLVNPFFPTQLFLPELSYFLAYIIAVSLAAALPYLINVNLRQRLQYEDVIQERQRLSRDIHDGLAQTLSALRWQAQLLTRRLRAMGIELEEIKQLETLTEKARLDTRESIEILRSYNGGGFIPNLRGYLKQLSQENNLTFHLDSENDKFRLGAPAELELMRICQEAISNIRKHAGANHVDIKVKSVDNHFELSIADDGCGFDSLAYYQGGVQTNGHGLAVMRERAESIGGRLRVLSMPKKGTEVQVVVPNQQGRWPWLKR